MKDLYELAGNLLSTAFVIVAIIGFLALVSLSAAVTWWLGHAAYEFWFVR